MAVYCFITSLPPAYTVKTIVSGGVTLKDYIQERAVELANYIVDTKNGESDFEEGDIFPEEAAVVVTYHTFQG